MTQNTRLSRLLTKCGGLVARRLRTLVYDTDASIFVEYLLLMTIVGIGTIAGLATVRGALLNELIELANSISAMVP